MKKTLLLTLLILSCIIIILWEQVESTDTQCKNLCEGKGFDTYQRLNSGSLELEDSCTCGFEEEDNVSPN